MEPILFQLTIYLTAAVVAVPISQRYKFGSVLGYLAAGLIIGPVFGLVGSETEDVQHYAEFGVVLMLFLIGLEMQPSALWAMRTRLVGLGGLQVGLTFAAIALVCLLLGVPLNQAIAIGIILSLSSTAIVMQTLAEKKLTHTDGGRASFAVLLFQDVAALPMLAVIPLLALAPVPVEQAEEMTRASEMVAGVSGWAKAALVIGAVSLVILAGRFLTRPFFRFIGMSRLREIHVAAALLFIAGISLLMSTLGLSPALGSFLAGMVLASSEYRHELESDLEPFRGLLMGLFFITVGAGIDVRLLVSQPAAVIGLTVAMMGLKLAILYPLARFFVPGGRDQTLFSLSLAQAGEFGFFLLGFAVASRVLPADVAQVLLLVIALSMMFTPALFLLQGRLAARQRDAGRAADEIDETGTVIIAGMGRFGQVVNRMLTSLGHKTVVLDSQTTTIERLRRFGIKGFYGAVERPDMLEAAGLAQARAIVIAIDDADLATRIAGYVSRRHPDVKIIARARDRHHVYQLYAAGAPQSVRETFDSALRAGKYALDALGYDEDEIETIARTFFEHDRHMLAKLAEVWDPAIPADENPVYIARAREQSAEIEAALRGRPRRVPEAAE